MNKRLLILLIFIVSLGLVLTGYAKSEVKGLKKLVFANSLPPNVRFCAGLLPYSLSNSSLTAIPILSNK